MSEKNKNEEQAFKDFKGSLTVGEFNTILRICKERYDMMKDIVSDRDKFVSKVEEQVEKSREQMEGMPDEAKKDAIAGIDKLMMALSRKGDKKLFRDMKVDIMESMYLTEFLNRFSEKSNEYEFIDFSFLKKYSDEI